MSINQCNNPRKNSQGNVYSLYKGIHDYPVEYGRTIAVKYSKDKFKTLNNVTISLTHLGALRFHLSQACGDVNVGSSFTKT